MESDAQSARVIVWKGSIQHLDLQVKDLQRVVWDLPVQAVLEQVVQDVRNRRRKYEKRTFS